MGQPITVGTGLTQSAAGVITPTANYFGAGSLGNFISYVAGLGAATVYTCPYDNTQPTATRDDHEFGAPTACTAVAMSFRSNAALGAGTTVTIRLSVNDNLVGAALTVADTDGTNVVSVALANIAIAQGDKVQWRLQGSGAGTIPALAEISIAMAVKFP